MAYNLEDTAKLKHIGALGASIKTITDALDGAKFGDVSIANGKINFFAKAGDTTPLKSIDLPEEIFLDQTQTTFVPSFSFSTGNYTGATNPNLDGKPVLVLAVKGDKTTNPTLTYSFINLETLIDTYTPLNAGITISGYSIGVSVSTLAGNNISIAADGLFATSKVTGATQGNIAIFGASGAIVDSGVDFATDAEFNELLTANGLPTVNFGS